MFQLAVENKIAWVTGGSRGIGRASAIALAKAGCDIALGFREKSAAAEETCASITSLGRRCLPVRADVASLEACADAHAMITSELGSVDILVNAAGITADDLFLMQTPESWDKVLQTNLMGCVHTSKLVVQEMMAKRWGRIIHFSSAAATKSGRGQSSYAAAKAAVEAMSRSLAVEIGKRGITVNCIAPGVVETDMSKEVIHLAKDEILNRQVIKRFASSEEIAAWVVMLASDYAGFMTGEVIRIDGGLKMV